MINDIQVGTGGWYNYTEDTIQSRIRLQTYSRRFKFVEVNSTFYMIFHPRTLERWRRSVPEDFEFAVKCYRALTHKIGIKPVEDAFRLFKLMNEYCRILGAQILVLGTPPSLKLDDRFVTDVRSFFDSVSESKVRIAWEFRGGEQDHLPTNVIRLMQDLNIIHTVDITFEDLAFESDILYTRIFGSAEKNNILHEGDLARIKQKLGSSRSRKAYISAHTPAGADDGERIRKILAV